MRKYFHNLESVEKDVFCAERSRIFVCKECFRFLVKSKYLNKDEIKKQMIESITINNAVEIEELNEVPEKVQKPKETVDIINQCEESSSHKKESHRICGILSGEHFQTLQREGKVYTDGKQIIIFKVIEKHPGLIKSSVILKKNFLKNYLKDFKKICKENSSKFE